MANQSGSGGSSITTPVSVANGGTGANNSAATGFQKFTAGVGSVDLLGAADIPDHSAAKLTSGTIPAARLPGVLADVDTQAELLAAAAAAAASHAHSGSDITSGTVAAARLPALSALSGAVTDGQLPSTSNNATIGAISTVANAALPKAGGTMSQALQFSSGTALSGANWGIYRNGNDLVFYSGDSNSRGQIGSAFQARVSVWGNASTYAGVIHEQARLITRANSTAYSICPVASTEVARILLQDDSSKRAVALVGASGTVTFESGSHADYVAAVNPASGEVGCYVTGGVFTIKPGSAGTRKIAAICQLGAN